MKLFNIFKKQKTRFVTGELISLNALAKVPDIDYFKDNNQFLLLINLRKKEYLETLIKEKVLTSSELKSDELQNKLNMLHNLIEQNTLGNDLFEKVIFDEQDKAKALIVLRKFTIYNEKINELEEEVVSRIIALKEILKRTFLNKQKRISIINEVNRLTNVFIVLMNQKETLKLCLSNYGKKCFDITKERDLEKEEDLIKKRKKELNGYQEQAFGKINTKINNLSDMALVEVALEEYVHNYNWKDSSLREKMQNSCTFLKKAIYSQPEEYQEIYNKILELENTCKIFYEFGKNIIDNEDLKKIYTLKFDFFTTWRFEYDSLALVEPFINEETSKLELETYEELIFGFINDLSNNDRAIFRIKTVFKKDYSTVIKLVKEELKTNGKYDSLEILKDKYKLNLLLAFSHPKYVQLLDTPIGMLNTAVLGNIYKSIYVKKCDYPDLNFYEKEFEWNDNLPLETINELKLAQNQKKDLGLYLFLKKHYYTDGHRKYTYTLPEGLNKDCSLISMPANSLHENSEKMKYVDVIRKNAAGKIVILPKSLISVTGDLFGDTYIPVLRLNEDLEYFNFNYLPSANIKKIEISSTVKPLIYDYHKPNNENLQEMYFYNFDKSCFYNNIDNLWLLLSPYIKITSKGYLVDGTLTFIHELTIAKLVFNFSDSSLYPNPIKLENFRMVYGNYNQDKIKLIERINNLIMAKIAEYRDIEKRKLTK